MGNTSEKNKTGAFCPRIRDRMYRVFVKKCMVQRFYCAVSVPVSRLSTP